MTTNLLSLSYIQEQGFSGLSKGHQCTILRGSDGACALNVHGTSSSYKVSFILSHIAYSSREKLSVSMEVCHARLGHTADNTVEKLRSQELIYFETSVANSSVLPSPCKALLKGEMSRRHFAEQDRDHQKILKS